MKGRRGLASWYRRAAIYAVLVLLPSTSLAWLGFANLESARAEQLRAQRAQALAALEALASDLARQVELRLARERERPFYEYEEYYRPIDAISAVANFIANPLASANDPIAKARWQVPIPPDTPRFDPASLSVLPRGEDGRAAVLENWSAVIEEEALRPPPSGPGAMVVCQIMPREVVASNRMQEGLRSRVERAQSGDREDNLWLGAAEQAWRANADPRVPAQETLVLTDLGTRVLARAERFEVLALREVALPPIASNGATAALPAARVMQGVVLDLAALCETSARAVRPYLAAEGISIELTAGSPRDRADSELERSLADLLGAGSVGQGGALVARVDPRAIESRVAERRRELRVLLAGLAVLVAAASSMAFRSLRREWQLLERQRAFVSAVTHELRTPVAGIRLYADLLEEGWVADEAQRRSFFGTLRGEADRLERLVDDVLHVAAFDRAEPHVKPELREEELGPLVREISEEFRRAPRERSFQLACGPLDAGRASIDRESLRRILFNLLENAVKYTPLEREPELAVRLRSEGAQLLLEVEDNACGLRDEERRRIFDDFYRVGDEARRTARGAGLGLGVVRRHVEALGGRVEVTSELGRGSTFRIILPRCTEW